MQTPLAWPRYAHCTDQNTSATSNQSTKLKRQTGSTNASSNTSYRQKTSKPSAEDRVGRRGSLSSPQRTEHSGSPVLNERDRSACQLDARKAAHYFLLHHQTVAYSWRPSAGSSAAKTPTFQYRLVFFRRVFYVFDRCWCSSHQSERNLGAPAQRDPGWKNRNNDKNRTNLNDRTH